jgi:hypothetical protein
LGLQIDSSGLEEILTNGAAASLTFYPPDAIRTLIGMGLCAADERRAERLHHRSDPCDRQGRFACIGTVYFSPSPPLRGLMTTTAKVPGGDLFQY